MSNEVVPFPSGLRRKPDVSNDTISRGSSRRQSPAERTSENNSPEISREIEKDFKRAFAFIILNKIDDFVFKSVSLGRSDYTIVITYAIDKSDRENTNYWKNIFENTIRNFIELYWLNLEKISGVVFIKSTKIWSNNLGQYFIRFLIQKDEKTTPVTAMANVLIQIVESELLKFPLEKEYIESIAAQFSSSPKREQISQFPKWKAALGSPGQFILKYYVSTSGCRNESDEPLIEMATIRKSDLTLFTAMARFLDHELKKDIDHAPRNREEKDSWIANYTSHRFGFCYVSQREATLKKYIKRFNGDEERARSALAAERDASRRRMSEKRKKKKSRLDEI